MMPDIRVRVAQPSDCAALARLREGLWPESSAEEHARELASILRRKPRNTLPLAIFVAEATDQVLLGFLEVGLRSHADGCSPLHPVGYVEGWYVVENRRQCGAGARLLAAAEDWARRQGCSEMASDALISNELSQRVHDCLGFQVVDRCVHYRKGLR